MVPGPRARESRSPLDSRGPLPNWQGASSFLQTARATFRQGCSGLALTLAITTGQYRSLMAHGPFTVNSERGFFYIPLARIVIPAKAGILGAGVLGGVPLGEGVAEDLCRCQGRLRDL